MIYQTERFSEFQEEFAVLCRAHWEEIARNRDSVPLSPDWGRYQVLDDSGMLISTTARDNGELVGYSLNFLIPHIHYSKTMFAFNDVLFLRKSHREGMAGIRLIKESIEATKQAGAEVIHFHIKKANDFGRILQRLGFSEIESVYELRV